jgi:glyoxylase-like metal-dependent hydrolase (beta-lactamase superfamily II)
VASDTGVLAVDVGMDSDAEDFLEGLRALDIPADRLKAILLTHWHNDHSAGASFLKHKIGVRVYYGGKRPHLARPLTFLCTRFRYISKDISGVTVQCDAYHIFVTSTRPSVESGRQHDGSFEE